MSADTQGLVDGDRCPRCKLGELHEFDVPPMLWCSRRYAPKDPCNFEAWEGGDNWPERRTEL